jgi:hypothetical protein
MERSESGEVGNILDDLTVIEVNSIPMDEKLQISIQIDKLDFLHGIGDNRNISRPNSLMNSNSKLF